MKSINDLKWFIQRGKYGYAECDFWNFDAYLTDIIIAGIDYLKNNSHGCPNEFYDNKNINNECEKWMFLLDEILKGFKAGKEIINDSPTTWKKYDGYYRHSFNEEKAKLLAKKFERGMELFSKHFLNLWD